MVMPTASHNLRFPRRFGAILLLTLLGLSASSQAEPVAAPRPHTALPNVHVLETAFTIPGLDRTRTLRVYLPPGYESSSTPYPVIYMYDGQNLFDDATSYVGEWGVDESMNELARSAGFEAIVVGIDHGGEKRMTELNPWSNARFGPGEGEQFLAFVVEVVKPYVDSHYRTRPGRESTAIIGSSMGGLMAHYAICRYPQVFSKAGVLSPAYWLAPDMAPYTRSVTFAPDARIYVYAGGKEGAEMTDGLKTMRPLLAQRLKPGQLKVHVAPAAQHNEKAWRTEFPDIVRWLFEL